MVWEYEAMLWEAGGDILTSDNKKAAFNGAEGVRALAMLQNMQENGRSTWTSTRTPASSENLFNSGNIGMMITGPWDLSSFPDVKYGVQVMPSFDPGGSHQTIAGPDNWVLFDNGPAARGGGLGLPEVVHGARRAAEGLDGDRAPADACVGGADAGLLAVQHQVPGVGTFADNLKNVLKARPQIPQYPRVSTALGQAIVNTLLGKGTRRQPERGRCAGHGFLAVPA